MRNFFVISSVYALSSFFVLCIVSGSLQQGSSDAAIMLRAGILTASQLFVRPSILVGLAIALFVAILRGDGLKGRLAAVLFAVLGIAFLQTGFLIYKNLIPQIIPFYADPALAAFDQWLGGGRAPWIWAHEAIASRLVTPYVSLVYLNLWGAVIIAFPLLLTLFDADRARVNRYIVLYVGSWIVIGNILALAGSSVGPVYYDQIYGAQHGYIGFDALRAALQTSGIADSALGQLQTGLWQIYTAQAGMHSSGISAFPSMHVASATVLALYFAERHHLLGSIGWTFCACIGFLSVYTGFHYAIDGIVSIGLVALGGWALKRFPRRAGALGTYPSAITVPAE